MRSTFLLHIQLPFLNEGAVRSRPAFAAPIHVALKDCVMPLPVPLLQFVSAVMARWPQAVLQFEDFSINHAGPLLERYREHHLVFNDDIQVRVAAVREGCAFAHAGGGTRAGAYGVSIAGAWTSA